MAEEVELATQGGSGFLVVGGEIKKMWKSFTCYVKQRCSNQNFAAYFQACFL